MPAKPRRPRGSLTPDLILVAAERLVEDQGLDALTMPAVAKEVDAAITSVYWHFRTRDDLLVALTEMVTAKIHDLLPAVDSSRPWDEEAYDYFCALRRELLQHPVYLTLFTSRSRFLLTRADVRSTLLARLEQEVNLFIGAGFTPVEAAHVYTACSTYVRGFCILEFGLTHERLDTGTDASGLVAKLDPKAFPTLSRLPGFEQVFWLSEAQFELGLRCILDGVKSGLPIPDRRAARRR